MAFIKRIILFSLVFVSTACQRAENEKTSLVLSLPPSEKVNSFNCTTCLKFLAVNISGEGIATTIYVKKEHRDFSENGTEISPDIELEVPVGKQRFFQVVAAYSNSDDVVEVHYGTSTVDLSGASNQISMTMENLGNFEGGHIAGRYLTSDNAGPTGVVNINLIPAPGHKSFTLFKTHIINGWFDFFASKNFEVTYEFESGAPILSNIKLNEDFLPASLTGLQVARIQRPSSYFQYNGSNWVAETESDTDVVIGFFFAPGFSDANKKICKQGTVTPLTRLSIDSGTTYMTYDPSGGTGDVRVFGGDGTCFTAFPQQYNANIIALDAEQFNGMGNDTAKSIEGAFSVFKVNGQMKKFDKSASAFKFHFLPHLLDNIYDGAKLFVAANQPPDGDNLRCFAAALSLQGFQEVPLASTSVIGNMMFVNPAAVISTGYGFVCPTLAGELRGHGGMYMGDLATAGSPAVLSISDAAPFNYGTIAMGGVTEHVFTIANSGGTTATTMGGTGLATPYQFKGGSYPGTGGSCGTSLAPANSCTIVVKFSPVSLGSSSDTMIIGYDDGMTTQVAARLLQGTSVAPAMLMISGSFDWGAIAVGGPSSQTFTITNTGGVAATTISGLGFSIPEFFWLGTNFPGGGTCTATLAAGAACTVTISFYPSAYILFTSTIPISYDDGATTQTTSDAIQGTGT